MSGSKRDDIAEALLAGEGIKRSQSPSRAIDDDVAEEEMGETLDLIGSSKRPARSNTGRGRNGTAGKSKGVCPGCRAHVRPNEPYVQLGFTYYHRWCYRRK
jgi:hypothetical protein